MTADSHSTSGPSGTGRPIRIGFIPLVDCAVLVAAAEKGFARAAGLDLILQREVSWANIRDKVNVGMLDCAHMLAGMPIASSLGIGHVRVPMLAPMALGLGGNAIAVSSALWRAMADAGADPAARPADMGRALRQVVEDRARAGEEPLTFAMVFPFSSHNYELRYWLASAGIHPDRDVRLVVIPPPLMVESLRAGQIQGFCAGSPWPGLAAEAGLGCIVASKAEIWQRSPEKVLGVPETWAADNEVTLLSLIRVLNRAAAWADDPANRAELAALLSRPEYVGVDAALILRALSGRLRSGHGEAVRAVEDFFVFHRDSANFPWRSHALWFYSQMVRWGQITPSPEAEAVAKDVYRPDLYRRALAADGVAMPAADAKLEGGLERSTPVSSPTGRLFLGPDRFFDGRTFDPDDIAGYLADFEIASTG